MTRLAILACVLAIGACASGGGNPFDGGGASRSEVEDRQTYSVSAFNPSFNDVTIFVVNAFSRGARTRVGRIGGSQERQFDFRITTAAREVRFELDYFNGPTCLTQPILLNPGDVIELILPGEPRNEPGCRRQGV